MKNLALILSMFLIGCNSSNGPDTTIGLDTNTLKPDSNLKIKVNQVGDFKKFVSPMMYSFKGMFTGGGSCFFYKQNSKRYLVSAKHCFSGYDYFNGKQGEYIDTLHILLNPDKVFYTDLIEYEKQIKKIINIKYEIDLFKIPVLPYSPDIYSYINEAIDVSYFDKIPDSVFLYGHPSEFFDDSKSNTFGKVQPVLITGDYISYNDWYFSVIGRKFNKPEDSQLMFLSSIQSTKGMSGSPVFGMFKKINGNEGEYVIKFVGVLIGFQVDTKKSWILKAKYAFNYLQLP